MPILKSQLGNKKLESIIEDERVEYCTFENEEYSNNLYDNEFEHCEFNNIILQREIAACKQKSNIFS